MTTNRPIVKGRIDPNSATIAERRDTRNQIARAKKNAQSATKRDTRRVQGNVKSSEEHCQVKKEE